MKHDTKHIALFLRLLWRFGFLVTGFTASPVLSAQTSPVTASLDSTALKIGEQIHYTLKVAADTTAQVVFPEGQTFLPMEMVEASPIDTLRRQDKWDLIKKYALTQFDSGVYTLPRQRILINNAPYYTDSLTITVRTVTVDTTKQKMYDIKPIIAVEKTSPERLRYLLYGLLALLLIGGALYWFVFRKKPLTEAQKEALLPPYDRALLALQKLDESRYLIQSEYKTYYSQLVNIVRAYLEEEIHVSALESTTDELIAKLELLKDSGNLQLDEDTLAQFKKVLQTADLVKFAKSTPQDETIRGDRKIVEQTLVKTKEALPEPTEEELLANAAYAEEAARKKRRKKIILATVITAAFLVIGTGTAIGYYGFSHLRDTIFGHSTKTLLQGEWVASEYDYPPISLETPKVLKRTDIPLPAEAKALIARSEAFSYGSMMGKFYILISSIIFKEGGSVDLQKAIDGSLAEMEARGARNILIKKEDFTTPAGKTGIKVFGTMEILDPKTKKAEKAAYILLSFARNGGIQQVVIIHKEDDPYAEKVVNRIIQSIDFKGS